MKKKYSNAEMSYLVKLVEESTEAIFSRGLDHKIISWNKGSQLLFGYTKEEAIGKTAKDLGIIKLTEEQIGANISIIIKDGSWQSEMYFFNRDGKQFYGAVSGNLIKDDFDNIISFYFIVKDISNSLQQVRKLKEANELLEAKNFIKTRELNDSEKLYENIFENSPLPMWIYNTETLKFLEVNELATIEYGYSKEEFLAMTVTDIQPEHQKEAFLNFVKSKRAEDPKYRKSYTKHKLKDGSEIDVEITSHKLAYKGAKARIVLSNNVTKRFAAEEKLQASELRFRSILEGGHDIINLFDENFNIIYRSPASERVTGWTDEDLIGKSGFKNIHPDDLDYAMQNMPLLMSTPGVHHNLTIRLINKYGEYRWVEGLIVNRLNDENVKAIVFNFRDITEKKENEKKLASTELRFRSILESSHDVVNLFDQNFNVIYRSPSSERITGWKDEEILGKSGFTNVYKDDLETAKQFIAKIINEPGVPFNVSVRLMNKSGKYKWVEGVINNLLNDENINAIVFNFRDITEKKESEDKLASSELKFRTILENGNDVVTLFDENFLVTYRSPSSVRILGWTDEDMIGKLGISNVHEDDLPYAKSIVGNIMSNPGKTQPVTLRLRKKNNNYIWIEGVIVNLLKDDKVNAILFNFRDVTDVKIATNDIIEREYQYRSLVERISDGFIALDVNARITYINQVAEKLFNRNPGLLIGKSLYNEFNNKIEPIFYNAIKEAIDTKKPSSIESYSAKLQKWISCILYPSETGVSCFIRDLSEKKKLEKELKEQQLQEQSRLVSAALEAQEQERNAIGIELHDNVNQILVGTNMLLSIIKNKSDKDNDMIEECRDLIKNAIHENRKIAHILVAPDLERNNLVNQINELAENMLNNASIKSEIVLDDYDDTLLNKEYIITIYRIVQEQFTNIIKHSKAGNVVITMSSPHQTNFVLKISDDGIGMDQQLVKKGIGLRNINSRLSVVNGKMKIDTNPGKGFTMEINIPIINNN